MSLSFKNRTTCPRIATVLAVAIALAAGGAAVAPASAAAQGDQAAVAVNTKDDSSLFRFAFSVRRVMGDVVDQSNAAVAFASCEECQTVAISIQVLLVMGDASVVTPTNLALALNVNCTLCETLASAYQFVFGGNGPLRFTAEGNRQIAEIRQAFQELRNSDLGIEEIQARTDELSEQLRDVIANELVLIGPPVEPAPESGAEPADEEAPAEPPAEETTPAEGETTTTTAPAPDEPVETAPEEGDDVPADQTETAP